MKKTLVFGPAYVELVSKVDTLPKGNEEVNILSTTTKMSGSGYVSAKAFQQIGFDCEPIIPIGEGIYGDRVKQELSDSNLPTNYLVDGINGCQYTLIDKKGNSSTFVMPGAEYEFDRCFMDDVWIDEIAQVVVFGEMLCGETDSVVDLIETLEDLEKEILFLPNGKSQDIGEEWMNVMLSFHPILCMSDTEAYYIANEYSGELRDVINHIYEMNQNIVLIVKQHEGVYYKDADDMYVAPTNEEIHMDLFIALLCIARNCNIDMKNSLLFACTYANHKQFQSDVIKQRLKELIRLK